MPRKQREKNKSKRSTALDRRRFHTRRVTPKTDAVGSVLFGLLRVTAVYRRKRGKGGKN
jgi:hypothetical protein